MHKKVHELLHRSLEELLLDFTDSDYNGTLDVSVLVLYTWSEKQTKAPAITKI